MVQEQNNVKSRSFNGLAIASLVLGIFWLWGLGSIAAIVLGIVAMRQIERSSDTQKGKGMAIGGIVLGAVGVLMIAFLVLVGSVLNNANKAAVNSGDPTSETQAVASKSSNNTPRSSKGIEYTDSQGNKYSVEIVRIDILNRGVGLDGVWVKPHAKIQNIGSRGAPVINLNELQTAIPTKYLANGQCYTPYTQKPGWCLMLNSAKKIYSPGQDALEPNGILNPGDIELGEYFLSSDGGDLKVIDATITTGEVLIILHDKVLPHS